MKNIVSADNPEDYVAALSGWQRDVVATLRAAVRSKDLDEAIKWGHLVYSSNGPVLLIRAEEARVLFGFWRGQRMRDIEPQLKPGGKYEMATLEYRQGSAVSKTMARRLAREAIELNAQFGDPTKVAKSGRSKPVSKRTAAKKRARKESA